MPLAMLRHDYYDDFLHVFHASRFFATPLPPVICRDACLPIFADAVAAACFLPR